MRLSISASPISTTKTETKRKTKNGKTQAQSLLEKLTGNLKDSVTLNVAGVDFTFIRDNAAYDQMLNDIESNNKVTPIKDYLLAIVAREQKRHCLKLFTCQHWRHS